jgi:ubiquinone/menaquinone biosynthesis C-methylase UbiE
LVTIDPAAASGFAQGAQAYARGRPAYPTAALDWLAEELALAPGASVLDLAAGTGKLTVQLRERGFDVLAVEPVGEMRAQLESALPGVRAVAGTAEAIPLADETLDAVFVGEAFHWFDGDAASQEIARVLRPGGGLALIWNVPQFAEVEWAHEWGRIVAPHVPQGGAVHRYLSGDWRRAFEPPGRFGELSVRSFDNAHVVDAAGFVAQAGSISFVANLDADVREELLGGIGALGERLVAERGGEGIEMRYRTEAYRALRSA